MKFGSEMLLHAVAGVVVVALIVAVFFVIVRVASR